MLVVAIILAVVIALLLIFGGVGFFFYRRKQRHHPHWIYVAPTTHTTGWMRSRSVDHGEKASDEEELQGFPEAISLERPPPAYSPEDAHRSRAVMGPISLPEIQPGLSLATIMEPMSPHGRGKPRASQMGKRGSNRPVASVYVMPVSQSNSVALDPHQSMLQQLSRYDARQSTQPRFSTNPVTRFSTRFDALQSHRPVSGFERPPSFHRKSSSANAIQAAVAVATAEAKADVEAAEAEELESGTALRRSQSQAPVISVPSLNRGVARFDSMYFPGADTRHGSFAAPDPATRFDSMYFPRAGASMAGSRRESSGLLHPNAPTSMARDSNADGSRMHIDSMAFPVPPGVLAELKRTSTAQGRLSRMWS